MRDGDPVLPGVEDQRFSAAVSVVLDFTEEDQVVAALVLGQVATHQGGDGAIQQRHARRRLDMLDADELVRRRPRKVPGQAMLVAAQHVDGEVAGDKEVGRRGW